MDGVAYNFFFPEEWELQKFFSAATQVDVYPSLLLLITFREFLLELTTSSTSGWTSWVFSHYEYCICIITFDLHAHHSTERNQFIVTLLCLLLVTLLYALLHFKQFLAGILTSHKHTISVKHREDSTKDYVTFLQWFLPWILILLSYYFLPWLSQLNWIENTQSFKLDHMLILKG